MEYIPLVILLFIVACLIPFVLAGLWLAIRFLCGDILKRRTRK
jgi:uncharacterized protein YneF (UPF0154 family)